MTQSQRSLVSEVCTTFTNFSLVWSGRGRMENGGEVRGMIDQASGCQESCILDDSYPSLLNTNL
jgi:hypothetical protein